MVLCVENKSFARDKLVIGKAILSSVTADIDPTYIK